MNQVPNATFLDGTTGWTGGVMAVDEATLGAPGRIALTSTGAAVSSAIPAAPGDRVHVFGHHSTGTIGAAFYNGAAYLSGLTVPMVSPASGAARRGLPSSFNFSRGTVVAPASTTAVRFGSSVAGAITKPFLQVGGDMPCGFQVGPHVNADLNYPSWPSELPAIMDEGLQADPVPTRKGFSGDTGVEATRRMTRSRRYRLSAQMALTIEEFDRLMQFFDETEGAFWFVRPGTHEVCLAQWLAEGEPVLGGRLPGRRRVQFKLQLRVV